MANFAILVIGDNSPERLEQWKEFEVDGVETPYVQNVDITKEAVDFATVNKDEFEPLVEYIARAYNYPIIPAHLNPLDCSKAKYGYVQVSENSQSFTVIRRTNPNAEFDYCGHQRGWRDFFKLKNGTHANSVTKNEANIPAKRVAEYVSAYIDDSGWISQGDISETDWYKKIKQLISNLDKNTKLTVFECHK